MSFYHIVTYEAPSSLNDPISITSIPQTYDDLVIYLIGRSSAGGSDPNGTDVNLKINGEGSFNFGNGQTGYSFSTTLGADTGASRIGMVSGPASESNVFAFSQVYFVNYTSSNQDKMFVMTSGWASQASSYFTQDMTHGLWNGTAAVTSLQFFNGYGGAFATGTQISLYGIKRN